MNNITDIYKNIHSSWHPFFKKWNNELLNIIKSNYENQDSTSPIYPPQDFIFKAFETNLQDIKIVLLAQDPYHQHNQAMGLAFSVPKTEKIPPSLVNIFKELKTQFPTRNYNFTHGDLTTWTTRENIFLLNCSLCVSKGKAGSHMKIWSTFTDDVIKHITENNKTCIFLLLGNFAKNKSQIINNDSRIVSGAHPSPLGAHKGFFGAQLFIKIEEKLNNTINWQN